MQALQAENKTNRLAMEHPLSLPHAVRQAGTKGAVLFFLLVPY